VYRLIEHAITDVTYIGLSILAAMYIAERIYNFVRRQTFASSRLNYGLRTRLRCHEFLKLGADSQRQLGVLQGFSWVYDRAWTLFNERRRLL